MEHGNKDGNSNSTLFLGKRSSKRSSTPDRIWIGNMNLNLHLFSNIIYHRGSPRANIGLLNSFSACTLLETATSCTLSVSFLELSWKILLLLHFASSGSHMLKLGKKLLASLAALNIWCAQAMYVAILFYKHWTIFLLLSLWPKICI